MEPAVELKIQRILVPIDFSDNSLAGLRYAQLFGEQCGAEIKLVHVVEVSPYEVHQQRGFMEHVPLYERVGTSMPRSHGTFVIKDVMDETDRQLRPLADEQKRGTYATKVLHGAAMDTLLQEIEAYRPDLVVMCTHGWAGLKHMLLGSVAERLVRLSQAPVLTIHAGKT